jgi:hypothetical protein
VTTRSSRNRAKTPALNKAELAWYQQAHVLNEQRRDDSDRRHKQRSGDDILRCNGARNYGSASHQLSSGFETAVLLGDVEEES